MVPLGEEKSNCQGDHSHLIDRLSLGAHELKNLFDTLSDWENQLQGLGLYQEDEPEDNFEEPAP